MTTEYAYVTLVMKNPHYINGAMVMAHSLKLTQTKYNITCMLTSDLYKKYHKILEQVFDYVFKIDYMYAEYNLSTSKQEDIYQDWKNIAVTKWRCLDLCAYKKICFLDADLTIMQNIDHLFELPAPAGAFVNFWHEKRQRNYHLEYGKKIKTSVIRDNLKKGYVAIGHCLVLKPGCNLVKKFQDFMKNKYEHNLESISMIDEKSLVAFMLNQRKTWTQLDHTYNTMPWHIMKTNVKNNVLHPPKILHFFNKEKPWITPRGKWPDTEIWWQIYDDLNIKLPCDKFNSIPKKTCPYCELIQKNKNHSMIRKKYICPRLKVPA